MLCRTALGIIISWLCAVHPALAMQKYKQQHTKITPTVPLLQADSLSKRIQTLATHPTSETPSLSEFELIEHQMVPQQSIPPQSDETLHEKSEQEFIVIDIEKKAVFAHLPDELLALALEYLDPFSQEAEFFLRMIPLSTESVRHYVDAFEHAIERIFTLSVKEQEKMARLLCRFMRILPKLSQTMSVQAYKQAVRIRYNATLLTDSLYQRVTECVGTETPCHTSVWIEDLSRCCKASFSCLPRELTAYRFRRVARATPAHAVCLLYAAKLYCNQGDLIKALPRCMRALLPLSLTKVFDMQELNEVCNEFWISFLFSSLILTIPGAIFLIVFLASWIVIWIKTREGS